MHLSSGIDQSNDRNVICFINVLLLSSFQWENYSYTQIVGDQRDKGNLHHNKVYKFIF